MLIDIITDSVGITKEAIVLGVSCLILRDSTESPETITIGTNEFIGINSKAIKPALKKYLKNCEKRRYPGKMGWQNCRTDCSHLLTLKV